MRCDALLLVSVAHGPRDGRRAREITVCKFRVGCHGKKWQARFGFWRGFALFNIRLEIRTRWNAGR